MPKVADDSLQELTKMMEKQKEKILEDLLKVKLPIQKRVPKKKQGFVWNFVLDGSKTVSQPVNGVIQLRNPIIVNVLRNSTVQEEQCLDDDKHNYKDSDHPLFSPSRARKSNGVSRNIR